MSNGNLRVTRPPSFSDEQWMDLQAHLNEVVRQLSAVQEPPPPGGPHACARLSRWSHS